MEFTTIHLLLISFYAYMIQVLPVSPSTITAFTKVANDLSAASQVFLTPLSTIIVGYVAIINSKMSKRIKLFEKANKVDHEYFSGFIQNATDIITELKTERDIFKAIDKITKNGISTVKLLDGEFNEAICQLIADMGLVTKSFSTQLSQLTQPEMLQMSKQEIQALFDAHAQLMRTKYTMLATAFIKTFQPLFVKRGKEYADSVKNIALDELNAKHDRFRIETEKFLSDLVTILLKKYFSYYKPAN